MATAAKRTKWLEKPNLSCWTCSLRMLANCLWNFKQVIQMFRGCKQEDMPPHIFAAAQSAYRNMLATRMDQSIVLMGHSGSGKTVNTRHIMHYLAAAASSPHSALTGEISSLSSYPSTQLPRSSNQFLVVFVVRFVLLKVWGFSVKSN